MQRICVVLVHHWDSFSCDIQTILDELGMFWSAFRVKTNKTLQHQVIFCEIFISGVILRWYYLCIVVMTIGEGIVFMPWLFSNNLLIREQTAGNRNERPVSLKWGWSSVRKFPYCSMANLRLTTVPKPEVTSLKRTPGESLNNLAIYELIKRALRRVPR